MPRLSKSLAALLLALLALAALAACRPDPGNDDSEGLQAFAAAFRAANQAATTGPMLELYHLEGTDPITKRKLQAALAFELGLPIASIQFEPLEGAPEETIAFEHQGVAYGPTLEPRRRMRVTYDTEDRLISLFTLGRRKDAAWRILFAAPRPAPKP